MSHGVTFQNAVYESWEGHIRTMAARLFGVGPESAELIRKLADHIKPLWLHFNKQREALDKHYMEGAAPTLAYGASFYLPNAMRVARVFDTLLPATWKEKCLASGELHIVDFGSGPLSATTGVLLSLCRFAPEEGEFPLKGRKIRVSAIERAERSVRFGEALLADVLESLGAELEVTLVTSPQKVEAGSAHVVVAANVFNEIPQKHRVKTLEALVPLLHPQSPVVVIEPGQDSHARALGDLRDSAISSRVALRPLGPCPHVAPCPLSQARAEASARKDWCWFGMGWDRPRLMQQLDDATRLDHRTLNWSVVAFQQEATQSSGDRMVSDPMPTEIQPAVWQYLNHNTSEEVQLPHVQEALARLEKAPGVYKHLVCTRDGLLESWWGVEPLGRRGDTLTKAQRDAALRVRERT